jgi:hypothetical protein
VYLQTRQVTWGKSQVAEFSPFRKATFSSRLGDSNAMIRVRQPMAPLVIWDATFIALSIVSSFA